MAFCVYVGCATIRVLVTYVSERRSEAVLFLTVFLVQQLSTRAAQLVSLLGRVPVVNAVPTVRDISEYVTYVPFVRILRIAADCHRFYNYVWLILNDVIIGTAIGSAICEQSESISSTLDSCIRVRIQNHASIYADVVQRLFISDLQKALVWLNNWPAGLKLNSELSQFYCHLLLGAVVGWNSESFGGLHGKSDPSCVFQRCWRHSSSLISPFWCTR